MDTERKLGMHTTTNFKSNYLDFAMENNDNLKSSKLSGFTHYSIAVAKIGGADFYIKKLKKIN